MLVRKEVEWQDLEVRFNGAKIAKIRGLDYGISTDKEHLFAEGDWPIGVQSGNKTPTGSLSVLKGALDDMYAAAMAAGARDLTDVQFDIVITWSSKLNRGLQTVVLVQCEFTEWRESMRQGDKFMEVALPFLYMDIKKTTV